MVWCDVSLWFWLAVLNDWWGIPWWLSGKKSACQCKRHGFYPWVGKTPWRRKWQPTPVFLPGKSHTQRSLVGYSLWDCKRARHDLVTKPKAMTSEVEWLFIGSLILGGTEQESLQWIIKRQISQGSLAWVQGALFSQGGWVEGEAFLLCPSARTRYRGCANQLLFEPTRA